MGEWEGVFLDVILFLQGSLPVPPITDPTHHNFIFTIINISPTS